jgi:glutamyl-tRNA synthetase
VDELVEMFTSDNFNTSNAVFDEDKLKAFNGEHIRLKSDHELATMIAPLLIDAGLSSKYWLETRWEYLRSVVGLLKQRVKQLSDFVSMGSYFFAFDNRYDKDAAEKRFTPKAADLMEQLVERFDTLPEFTTDNTEQALTECAEDNNLKRAALIHPTRLAVSGVPAGPGLYEILTLLGKTVVLERMKKAITYIREVHRKQV